MNDISTLLRSKSRFEVWKTLLFCLLIMTLLTKQLYSQESDSMDSPQKQSFILYIKAIAGGGSAELRINDLPVGNTKGDGALFSRNIEGFLLPGRNTLSIHPHGKDASVQARIAAYKSDEFVDGRGGRTFVFTESLNGEWKIYK